MPNPKAILGALVARVVGLVSRKAVAPAAAPGPIKPTVGRVVWFFPATLLPGYQPQPAIIAHVWSDTVVNLAIFDATGNPVQNPPTSVPLLSAGSVPPGGGNYCTWMPYQHGQAAKTEALEKQLAAKG